MHIGKGDQAGFFIQFWRGIAVIAEDAEIFGPGAFAHHQYGQGFTGMGLPGRVSLGVFTDFDKRLLRGNHLFTQIAGRGTDVVTRHHHQTQLMVIAKQRRQALVVDQGNAAQDRD
ncbi:hypothetical protein D3C85_1342880 [compost metagenome]